MQFSVTEKTFSAVGGLQHCDALPGLARVFLTGHRECCKTTRFLRLIRGHLPAIRGKSFAGQAAMTLSATTGAFHPLTVK
jgi:hypothetical protein